MARAYNTASFLRVANVQPSELLRGARRAPHVQLDLDLVLCDSGQRQEPDSLRSPQSLQSARLLPPRPRLPARALRASRTRLIRSAPTTDLCSNIRGIRRRSSA